MTRVLLQFIILAVLAVLAVSVASAVASMKRREPSQRAVPRESCRLVRLALLLSRLGGIHSLTAITNDNINATVMAWMTNPSTATITYGNIVTWNTAAVSVLSSLFGNSFNDDISKWNVASVTSMSQACT